MRIVTGKDDEEDDRIVDHRPRAVPVNDRTPPQSSEVWRVPVKQIVPHSDVPSRDKDRNPFIPPGVW